MHSTDNIGFSLQNYFCTALVPNVQPCLASPDMILRYLFVAHHHEVVWEILLMLSLWRNDFFPFLLLWIPKGFAFHSLSFTCCRYQWYSLDVGNLLPFFRHCRIAIWNCDFLLSQQHEIYVEACYKWDERYFDPAKLKFEPQKHMNPCVFVLS